MSKELVVLVTGHHTHAASAGERRSLCGVVGVPVAREVHSSFDVTCELCQRLVQRALGLTALTDPGNVGFVVVEDEQ